MHKLERYRWVVWLILAFGGAAVSYPHTVNIVMPHVPVYKPGMQLVYMVVLFITVELALFGLKLMEGLEHIEDPKQRFTLARTVNSILSFIGVTHQINLEHVEKKRRTSSFLIAFLFFAALSFNLMDVYAETEYFIIAEEAIRIFVQTMIGLLGPTVVLIAGNQLATEFAIAYRNAKPARRTANARNATASANSAIANAQYATAITTAMQDAGTFTAKELQIALQCSERTAYNYLNAGLADGTVAKIAKGEYILQ